VSAKDASWSVGDSRFEQLRCLLPYPEVCGAIVDFDTHTVTSITWTGAAIRVGHVSHIERRTLERSDAPRRLRT